MAESSTRKLLGASPGIFGTTKSKGFNVSTFGAVLDEKLIVYLQIGATKTACEAIWAAVMNNDVIEINGVYAKRSLSKYLTVKKAHPETGGATLAILSHQAMPKRLVTSEPFYVVSYNGDPPLDRFYSMLNRAVSIPLMIEWTEILWARGIMDGLVAPCSTTKGGYGWRVDAKADRWRKFVEIIIGGEMPVLEDTPLDQLPPEILKAAVAYEDAIESNKQVFDVQARRWKVTDETQAIVDACRADLTEKLDKARYDYTRLDLSTWASGVKRSNVR